jgi:hypothetical protein
MENNTVYWKMRNSKLVSVDEMDTNHIKNAFKHLIKHHQNVVQQANEVVDKYNALIRKRKVKHGSASFNLNGNIDQSFNNDMELWDMEMEAGITDIETGIL